MRLPGHVSVDEAGTEGVDPDAVLAEGVGHVLGQRDHAALGGRVGVVAGAEEGGPPDQAVDGREIDHRAAALLLHAGGGEAGHQIGTLQVDGDHPVPGLLVVPLRRRVARRHPGAVDQDVDAPVALHHRLHHPFGVARTRHIAGERERGIAAGGERGGALLDRLRVPVREPHRRALGREQGRGGGPDPRTGARHQRHLVPQSVCHSALPPGAPHGASPPPPLQPAVGAAGAVASGCRFRDNATSCRASSAIAGYCDQVSPTDP